MKFSRRCDIAPWPIFSSRMKIFYRFLPSPRHAYFQFLGKNHELLFLIVDDAYFEFLHHEFIKYQQSYDRFLSYRNTKSIISNADWYSNKNLFRRSIRFFCLDFSTQTEQLSGKNRRSVNKRKKSSIILLERTPGEDERSYLHVIWFHTNKVMLGRNNGCHFNTIERYEQLGAVASKMYGVGTNHDTNWKLSY